ncbi:hypothetical protein, partial [Streptococcus suis]
KVQKSVSTPSVSDPRVKPSIQKQNAPQKPVEARRPISEPQPTKTTQKPIQTKIEQNRPISESPSKVQKSVSTPSVSDPRVKPSIQKQNAPQKPVEARRPIS